MQVLKPNRFFTYLPLLSPTVAAAGLPSGRSHHLDCKPVPGSAGWPSPESWSSLNGSTGGRLLQSSPPGAVCHPGQPGYDAAKCAVVQSEWRSYNFHQSDPVSSMWNQFTNDSCLPDPGSPCSGQGYPVFVINASTPHHVKLGVDFAREHNIRLVVKSTGHDYVGRSVAPNSLSIWTHHMKGIAVHDSFQPSGCDVNIEGGAATVGAGSQMGELYEYLNQFGKTIVGGGGATVSVGGYLTGGGHALLSPRYGLAADQVLEMEVVSAQGEILTVNECKNADLFWAMRGGGGSTFAIMTSATMRTYPSPQITSIDLIVATTSNSTSAKWTFDLVTYVLGQYPLLSEQGMSGYSYIFQDFPNPTDNTTRVSGIMAGMVLQDVQSSAVMLEAWDPILAHIVATWPGFTVLPNVTTYGSFWAWYRDHHDTSLAGKNSYVGSRLLDGPALTADPAALGEAFRQFSSEDAATAYLVSGKGVWDAQPRGGSNAVLPAWRKAYVHATCGVDFEPLNATAKADALTRLGRLLDPLRKLAPSSGAYMNEADPQEPGWQHEFWGANYPRLVSIKRAADPDDVFWCHPCVGNERWHEVDGQLCRVGEHERLNEL